MMNVAAIVDDLQDVSVLGKEEHTRSLIEHRAVVKLLSDCPLSVVRCQLAQAVGQFPRSE